MASPHLAYWKFEDKNYIYLVLFDHKDRFTQSKTRMSRMHLADEVIDKKSSHVIKHRWANGFTSNAVTYERE